MKKRQKMSDEKCLFNGGNAPTQITSEQTDYEKLRGQKRGGEMNSSLPSNEMIPSSCDIFAVLGGRLHQPSPLTQAALIFIIIIHVITFPFTAVFNPLVMLAVKLKPRLRAHKSNILLALLASTDFVVGVIVQPIFIALNITFLLDKTSSGACVLQVFSRAVTSCLGDASLIHVALISGERYLAIKHSFAYTTLVTETRLMVASAMGWLLSVILHIPLAVDQTVFLPVNNAFIGLSVAFIVFCHVVVYLETRLHEQQLATQQVTQEAREQFENNKKALKLTSIILAVIMLCYIPTVLSRIVLLRYRSKMSLETVYIIFFLAVSMGLLNSLFNPIIYSIRMRHFRVAFIELIYRTVNFAEAEEIEMRVFGAPNAVVRLEVGRKDEGQDRQNLEQANIDDSDNGDKLPQDVNFVVNQQNNNLNIYRVQYRHSI